MLRRAVRHPRFRNHPDVFPAEALVLCIVAHQTKQPIANVFRHYVSVASPLMEHKSLSLPLVSRVYKHGWLRVLPQLQLTMKGFDTEESKNPSCPMPETPVAPKTPKTPQSTALFSTFKIFLVPSPLFSTRSATLLQSRVRQNGGDAEIVDSGQTGLRKVCADQPPETHHDRETSNVVVIADQTLINRAASHIDTVDVRPPKWLTDTLRADRIKSRTLYTCSPLPPRRAPRKPTVENVHTKTVLKRPRSRCTLTDFRAEVNIGEADMPSAKRRRITVDVSAPSADGKRDGFDGDDTHHTPTVRTSDTIATRLFTSPNDKIATDTISATATPQAMALAKQGEHPNDATAADIGSAERPQRVQNWACEIRVGQKGKMCEFPMNERVCELLGIVQESYTVHKDNFRAVGYQRAIARIRSLDFDLECCEDVRRLQDTRHVGGRMVRKIDEIVRTGRLQQADAILHNSDYRAVTTLCDVWGIGPVKGLSLVSRGIRGIADLRAAAAADATLLDRCQTIGLRLYEDLLERIPRAHVHELEVYTRRVVKGVDVTLDIVVAGSYLRGKESCGDVDILVYGEAKRVKASFVKIRDVMKKNGVITDDLVDGEDKYFGVFRLPGRKHGRIDLFAVPLHEFPYALLTYTGSAIFNRFVRCVFFLFL